MQLSVRTVPKVTMSVLVRSDLAILTSNTPLPLLGPHLPTFILAITGFYTVQLFTHRFAPAILGKKWEALSEKTRIGFASHVVCECLARYRLVNIFHVVAVCEAPARGFS
jgi:hypothetical protein